MSDDYLWGNMPDEKSYYDDQNKRLAAMPDPVETPFRAPRPRRHQYIPHLFTSAVKQIEAKNNGKAVSFPKQKNGAKILDISKFDLPDGTHVERVSLEEKGQFFTICRYDGSDRNCILDINGRTRSASMDEIGEIVDGALE